LLIMDDINEGIVSVLNIYCYLTCLLAFKFTGSVTKPGRRSQVIDGVLCAS